MFENLEFNISESDDYRILSEEVILPCRSSKKVERLSAIFAPSEVIVVVTDLDGKKVRTLMV